MLYFTERSPTNKEKVLQSIRMSFKRFLLLKKNIKNEFVTDLCNFNFEERATYNMIITKRKWEDRVGKKLYVEEEMPEQKPPQHRRILPIELQEYLNLMTAKCPQCLGQICKEKHMREQHNINIPTYETVIREIERRTDDSRINKLSRKESLEHIGSFIKLHIDTLILHLNPIPSLL
jgi:hypothetical protein